MSRGNGSIFLVITTAAAAARIRGSVAFQVLDGCIDTEFAIIQPPTLRNKYRFLNRQQMIAIRRSADFDTLFFLYPDFLFADGTIATTIQRLANGHDAVVLPVPRVLDHSVRAALGQTNRPANGAIALQPREFVSFCNRHFHPAMWSHLWGSRAFSSYPSNLLWRGSGDSLLFRCFHLHPLAIRVQFDSPTYGVLPRSTLDEEYLPRLFADIGTIHCVADSDEAAICSLTPEEFAFAKLRAYQRPDVLFVARWAEASASALHRQFVERPYRWHSGDIPSADWQSIESESAKCVRQILERLEIPDMVLRVEDRLGFRMRRIRAKRFSYWAYPSKEKSFYVANISDFGLTIVLLSRLGFYRITGRRFWAAYRWTRETWRRLRGLPARPGRAETDWVWLLGTLQRAEVSSVGAIALELTRRVLRRNAFKLPAEPEQHRNSK